MEKPIYTQNDLADAIVIINDIVALNARARKFLKRVDPSGWSCVSPDTSLKIYIADATISLANNKTEAPS